MTETSFSHNHTKQDPSTKLILIADDEESISEFLKYFLSQQGFNVETVYNGNAVIEKCKTVKPDLIILDAMLPGKSGYEVVKQLQLVENFRQIPVIIITGRLRDPQFRTMFSIESNVKNYFLKPIQPDLLIAEVHKLLGTKPKEEKIAEQKGEEFRKQFEK